MIDASADIEKKYFRLKRTESVTVVETKKKTFRKNENWERDVSANWFQNLNE